MHPARLSLVGLLLVGLAALVANPPSDVRAQGKAEEYAGEAKKILEKYCFECHAPNPKKSRVSGGLNLLDRKQLLDREQKIVVAKTPSESKLIEEIENGNMPPGKRDKVTDAEVKLLRAWIDTDALPFPEGDKPVVAIKPPEAGVDVARVKEVFRAHCLDCHGGRETILGLKILDHDLLLKKKKVEPGKPEGSRIFQLVTANDDSVMPPKQQPRLVPADVELIRQWIAAGAPAFPPDAAIPVVKEKDNDPALANLLGVDYVMQSILTDVRTVKEADRRFVRYLSFNHLLTGGASKEELELRAEALAKAVNHLHQQPALVRPRSIEATNTVFRIDLRELGWDKQPLDLVRGTQRRKSDVNIYDLVLLEYPYSIMYEASDTYDQIKQEFLDPANQLRPVCYVRADWFIATATQPPLYHDLLQLPHKLDDLEKFLAVDTQKNIETNVARRGGMSVSGVSQNNRVVERHPTRFGYYWKSYDFKSSKGQDNIYKDPVNLKPTGGEMIFTLPNGLQGYYVADGLGNRLDFAPTEIVTDKFAKDQTVRNGLACMRCHDQGMKELSDNVRDAIQKLPGSAGIDKRAVLELYAPKAEMDKLLADDGEKFMLALEKLHGKRPTREPLYPVAKRFLDDVLQMTTASGELGYAKPDGLQPLFGAKNFAGLGLVPLASDGVVKRDMWEDYYDQVVREMGLGVPIVPYDGLIRRDHQAVTSPVNVVLRTNRKNNLFASGDEATIEVENKSDRDVFIELVVTTKLGRKAVLQSKTLVKKGETFKRPPIKIQPDTGKDQVTVFASDKDFPAGVLLKGDGVTDRYVHALYRVKREGKRNVFVFDSANMVKKTMEIETR